MFIYVQIRAAWTPADLNDLELAAAKADVSQAAQAASGLFDSLCKFAVPGVHVRKAAQTLRFLELCPQS